jgi:malonyl CoA-acyl carrier protein transacylase
VSGTRAGLDALLANHKQLGWRRATPLPVGGAFHSPLMAPAQDELDKALTSVLTGLTKRIRNFEHQFAPASLAELEGIEP